MSDEKSNAPSKPLAKTLATRIMRILILLALSFSLLLGILYYLIFSGPGKFKGNVLEKNRKKELGVVEKNLKKHVSVLAQKIGIRCLGVGNAPKLRKAEKYIREQWQSLEYKISEVSYKVKEEMCHNLEISRIGTKYPKQIIVVGAHYDTYFASPGANDNGSGTAAVLELARIWAKRNAKRTVRFVAFVNEEPPYFETAEQGSVVYAKTMKKNKVDIRAMISVETIGYYTNAENSQKYPEFFKYFYPSVGNFIAIVGNLASRSLVMQTVSAHRQASSVPCEHLAAPSIVGAARLSDHAAFWDQGYKAIMVTDTAFFRYKHYHTAADTPEKLDYAIMSRVTLSLDHIITTLANQE